MFHTIQCVLSICYAIQIFSRAKYPIISLCTSSRHTHIAYMLIQELSVPVHVHHNVCMLLLLSLSLCSLCSLCSLSTSAYYLHAALNNSFSLSHMHTLFLLYSASGYTHSTSWWSISHPFHIHSPDHKTWLF